MPSGMDPQYPYGQAETEASLAQVLSDQQALAWRAHELWQRDAAAAGIHSQEAAALLRHLGRLDPDLSPASVEDLRALLDRQLQQLETRVEELRGVLRATGAGPLTTIGGAGCWICSSDGQRYGGPSTW